MAKLDDILKQMELLRNAVPELGGVLLASTEGLPIAHAFTNGEDPKRVAAMTAAASSLGKRLTESLGNGPLSEVCVSGEGGQLFMYYAGPKAVLAVLGPNTINWGLLHLEARSTAEHIARLLGGVTEKASVAA